MVPSRENFLGFFQRNFLGFRASNNEVFVCPGLGQTAGGQNSGMVGAQLQLGAWHRGKTLVPICVHSHLKGDTKGHHFPFKWGNSSFKS